MLKFVNAVFRLERWVCGILLLFMLVIVFLGTVGRYTGLFNIPWGDEAARYTMVWIVYLGAGLGAFRGELFNIDVIVDKLSPRGKKVCLLLSLLLVAGFCVFAVIYGFMFVDRQIMMRQNSPSLKLPMWFMYSSVPVGCLLLLIHYAGFAVNQFRRLRQSASEGGETC